MEENPYGQHYLAGKRSNGSVVPKVVERSDRRWMDAYFGRVTDRLNCEQERVVTSKPASHCFPKADVKTKALVVASQSFGPADRPTWEAEQSNWPPRIVGVATGNGFTFPAGDHQVLSLTDFHSIAKFIRPERSTDLD